MWAINGTVSGTRGSVHCSPSRFAPALLLLLVVGCREEKGSPLLRVAREAAGPGATRLTLIPAPGVRINARLTPALERIDGSILHFAGGRMTPDSSYFIDSPALETAGSITGRIRASVCPEHQAVCLPVEVHVED